MTPHRLLAPAGDDGERTVALRGRQPLSRAAFERAVGGRARAFAGRARVVLACRDGWNLAAALLGALTAGVEVALPANDRPATLAGFDGLVIDDAWTAEDAAWAAPPAPQGRLVFHTSGSSGPSQPVVRPWADLLAEIARLEQRFGAGLGPAATLATVPFQHAFGLMFALLWPLAAGRVFQARRQALWEDLLTEVPPDAVVVSSPAHLARMDGLTPLPAARRPRLVLSAGAPLPETAAAQAARVFGRWVTEIYGSSETGAVAGRRRDGQTSPWLPLPGLAVAATADGLLSVNRQVLADRVAMAQDGGFHLLGRADRIAKIEGKRVALDEIEAALLRCPEVAEAATVILDGAVPTLAALVVPSAAGWDAWGAQGGFRLGRALRRRMAEGLDPAALPRRWRFVARLPLGPLGKRRNADMAALFQDAPRLPELIAVTPGADAGASVGLDLAIPENLWWFQGHFPGRPILPGLVQLDWALHFARAHLGVDLIAAQDFQVKYKATIAPRDRLRLDLRRDDARGRLSFSYRRDGRDCSSGAVSLP